MSPRGDAETMGRNMSLSNSSSHFYSYLHQPVFIPQQCPYVFNAHLYQLYATENKSPLGQPGQWLKHASWLSLDSFTNQLYNFEKVL